MITALIIIGSILLLSVLTYIFCIFPSKKAPVDKSKFFNVKYAHRGLHNKSQGVFENTLTAFSLAVENGYGIELDVHVTKDGVPVIMHDNSLARMCGADITVNGSNWNDIKDIKIKETEKIPLLSDVLSLVDGRSVLLVELKADGNNADALCREAFKLLDDYKGDYCIESFDPRVIAWVRKHRPNVLRGQLSCKMKSSGKGKLLGFALENLMLNVIARPHFVAYCHSDRSNISLKLNRFFGADIYYWTVRSKDDAKLLLGENSAIIFEGFDANNI